MQQNGLTKKLIAWSALMTALAGVIHLWIVPEHWAHAPAHGMLFLVVGIAQIVWGVVAWRRPSIGLYTIGAVMAGWLIVLYAITRCIPAPFGHGSPEAIDAMGLACKLCEGLGMFSLVLLIFQGVVLKAGRFVAWQRVAMVVLLSFVAGFATYGVARAAEPAFPWLAGSGEEDHHHEDSPMPADESEHEHDDDH